MSARWLADKVDVNLMSTRWLADKANAGQMSVEGPTSKLDAGLIIGKCFLWRPTERLSSVIWVEEGFKNQRIKLSINDLSNV
jgi:hypothetical protein